MPLAVLEDGDFPAAESVFFIFYSSRDDSGQLWCPDCRDVEELVKSTFEESSGLGLIIYVGQEPEWKSDSNEIRSSFNIQSIPTIVRLNNGSEDARLVDGEISEPGKLEQLIRELTGPGDGS